MSELVARQPADLEGLTLDELADEARRGHEAAMELVASAVQYAIRVGDVLLIARERVERGGWLAWLEANGLSGGIAYVYMRIAQFRDEIPVEEMRTVTAAYSYLRGRALPATGNRWKYPDEIRQEALRLVDDGMEQQEVAELLGVNSSTITYWVDPEYRKQHQRKSRDRNRRRRAAAKALAEKEKREERDRAAKSAGGALADAYSKLRLHIEALDQAIKDATDRGTQAILREALDHAYKAEDKIAEALKVS